LVALAGEEYHRLNHAWNRALLKGASGVFVRGGKTAPEIDEEQVKELHAMIGARTVANDFFP